ncbi:MAG: hypothetical protein ABEL97_10045, partial [Salinibacter sp.]
PSTFRGETWAWWHGWICWDRWLRQSRRPGRQPLTLAYASPEQVEGGEISTQTDVYQFGALAYELSADTRPFDFDTSPAETERIITEEPPPAPSARANSPARVGEGLDTIVLKALRKAPRKRYSEAEPLLKRSLQVFRDRGKENVQAVRADLASLYAEWGRPDGAVRYRDATTAGTDE